MDHGAGIVLRIALTVLVSSIAVLVGCDEQERGRNGVVIAESDSYEASLYRQNCAICHGKEAYGKVVDGTFVPSLRTGEAAKRTDREIYQQIAVGKLPMPSFGGQLTEEEIQKMVIFVRRDLQGRDESSKQ